MDLDKVMHHNEGDTPDATEDITTTQQEALVPYPVINTVDGHPQEKGTVNLLMSFSSALNQLKFGNRVARNGWNGKNMWLKFISAANYTVHAGTLDNQDRNPFNPKLLPWIGMKTADDKFVPWLPSQTDILAEDWVIL